MNLRHVIPVVAALTLAAVVAPASACDGHSKSASLSRSTAWAGAWRRLARSSGCSNST